MNSEICFDACRNIYGKSSSTFWGIFIKIPKLIPRVATLMYNQQTQQTQNQESTYLQKLEKKYM